MANKSDEHTGSGLDKPDPKTLLEKVGEGLKAVLPKKAPEPALRIDTGSGTEPSQPE